MHDTHRPTDGRTIRAEFDLGDDRLVTIPVRAGDLLRSEAGVVWATVENDRDDIVLPPGGMHRVAADARMHLSGFGRARAALIRTAAAARGGARPPLRALLDAMRAWAGGVALAARPAVHPAARP